jgi:hypothetical protein
MKIFDFEQKGKHVALCLGYFPDFLRMSMKSYEYFATAGTKSGQIRYSATPRNFGLIVFFPISFVVFLFY